MEAGGNGKLIQNHQDDQHRQQHDSLMLLPSVNNNSDTVEETAIVMTKKTIHRRGKSPIEKYGEETVRIAVDAAKLKRAEVMATTVNAKYNSDKSRVRRKPITADNLSSDASMLRSFLVSISEEWRALVIRSAACLYRLKGIVDEGKDSINNGRLVYSTTSMQTARDALKVYAPLAQRMGMQRLKSQIENTAFRILYPRQYDVSSALHERDLAEMNTIIQVLASRIEELLKSDEIFMANIDSISVSSRVKEPYSLWKKILRYRKEAVKQSRDTGTGSTFMPPTLSTRWVPDAIALRVILRGKQLPMADEESLRTREKMLCYFALQIISDVWPASEANFAKDYIKNPKVDMLCSLEQTIIGIHIDFAHVHLSLSSHLSNSSPMDTRVFIILLR
jgi:(p)ppGpp synthase/HD superfamily hydrolase